MGYAVFLVLSILLFVGFIALTRYEARRGSRVFAGTRESLDAEAERLSFAASHVDFPAFIRESLRALAARIIHDIAHGSLIVVRFVERLLTRIVRTLRARRGTLPAPDAVPQGPTAFVAAMKDFKQELKNGRREEAAGERISDTE